MYAVPSPACKAKHWPMGDLASSSTIDARSPMPILPCREATRRRYGVSVLVRASSSSRKLSFQEANAVVTRASIPSGRQHRFWPRIRLTASMKQVFSRPLLSSLASRLSRNGCLVKGLSRSSVSIGLLSRKGHEGVPAATLSRRTWSRWRHPPPGAKVCARPAVGVPDPEGIGDSVRDREAALPEGESAFVIMAVHSHRGSYYPT